MGQKKLMPILEWLALNTNKGSDLKYDKSDHEVIIYLKI